ncbi:MAG: CAP domain-containing protein [Chloroflexota bacterium]
MDTKKKYIISKKIYSLISSILIFALAIFFLRSSAQAGAPTSPYLQASALVAEVNKQRTAKGLSPYRVDAALMAAAQGHAEYMARSGAVTHTGVGGSAPADRAKLQGYGSGTQIFVTENIYSGASASPATAVNWWIADGGWHLEGVMSTTYQDVGAGIATGSSGALVYFTLDVGYIAGGVSSGGQGSSTQSAASATRLAAAQPVIASSPAADGSIIHIIQPGQTLWTISATYKVPLPELLSINNLKENSFVHPGDKVIVRKPGSPAFSSTIEIPLAGTTTAQSTALVTDTIQSPPTVTSFPTSIPTTLPPVITSIAIKPTPTPAPTGGIDPLRAIAALIIGVIALTSVLILSFVKKSE